MNQQRQSAQTIKHSSKACEQCSAAFSLSSSQQLKLNLKAIWEELSRLSKSQKNLLYFPYHLIRQQSEQHAIACRHSYTNIVLGKSATRRIRNIEVEVLAIDSAFKCISFAAYNEQRQEILNILIALRTIFGEFKDNRNADCQQRLQLFEKHVTNLIQELKEHVYSAAFIRPLATAL